MQNKVQKLISIMLVATLIIVTGICSNTDVQAITKKKWITNKKFAKTYYVDWHNTKKEPNVNAGEPEYGIIIKKIKKNKVKFFISYIGTNWSPLIETKEITAKIKGNKAKFKWRDSWGCSGTGTLKFMKSGILYLKVVEKKTAEGVRGTLSTKDGYNIVYKKGYVIARNKY